MADRRFGPSARQHVAGHVELAAITRTGVCLDPAQVTATQQRLRQELADHVARVRNSPGCDGLFKTDRDGKFWMERQDRAVFVCCDQKAQLVLHPDLELGYR